MENEIWVTPCVGVWIETNNWEPSPQIGEVTPCVGVWIETFLSVPMDEEIISVTPCVGVWIETNQVYGYPDYPGHTLRGCVD